MTEAKSDISDAKAATDEKHADFEGHGVDAKAAKAAKADLTDARAATDDDGADFEGHRLYGADAKAAKAAKA